MLMDLPFLTLYSIDPWKHIEDGPYESGLSQKDLDDNHEIARSRLKDYGDRSIIIRKKSDEAINDVPDEIDFVFIDGDHSFEQVLRDLRNYAEKVKKGGIVAGHDYIHQEGVTRAVGKYFKDNTVNLGDDDTWYVFID
jgi:predicted O-methyltransferase YrrM